MTISEEKKKKILRKPYRNGVVQHFTSFSSFQKNHLSDDQLGGKKGKKHYKIPHILSTSSHHYPFYVISSNITQTNPKLPSLLCNIYATFQTLIFSIDFFFPPRNKHSYLISNQFQFQQKPNQSFRVLTVFLIKSRF